MHLGRAGMFGSNSFRFEGDLNHAGSSQCRSTPQERESAWMDGLPLGSSEAAQRREKTTA